MSSSPIRPRPDDGARPDGGKLGPNYRKLFGASVISNLGDGIGKLAYPWLASATTRNPMLIALVLVVQRLPWLIFSLPAGIVTDRMSRRILMIRANAVRFVVTLGVAFVVLSAQDDLPSPDLLGSGAAVATDDTALYLIILVATLLLGIAEVFYDNAAQTFMPAVVDADDLERANGRLWSAELVTNEFAGPPLGGWLLAIAFALPFFVDAATFAASALLIMLIPATVGRRSPAATQERQSWRHELKVGFRWLWRHPLLRPMAIILGLLNALGMLSGSILVLFAQEVLGTDTREFAILSTGAAVGGAVGGWTASWISKQIGPGASLSLTLVGGGLGTAAMGLVSTWPLAWVLLAFYMVVAVLWNVITVSLRQAIIPDNLLGRVNSVYRFFAWGMMPLGSVLGGLLVVLAETVVSREMALRLPWFAAGGLHLLLFVFAAPKLTTSKIEAARSAALQASDSVSAQDSEDA